jgi:hypothetical protein
MPHSLTLNGADCLLRSLVAECVDRLFLVPGGLADPFMPALGRVPELVPIVAAQEGGAAIMSDGHARASGKFGGCLCIGGSEREQHGHRTIRGARRRIARADIEHGRRDDADDSDMQGMSHLQATEPGGRAR